LVQLTRKRLDELERTIERGLQTFVNVGNALREIKDDNLHTVDYDTFEAYCAGRWGMARQHAYRLMDSAAVTENLRVSPIGDKALPTTESQARPLTQLDPEDQPVAWELAIEKAGDGKVTAAIVEQAVAELSDDPPTTEVHTRKSKDPRPQLLRAACRNIREARQSSQAYQASALRATEKTLRKIVKQIENPQETL